MTRCTTSCRPRRRRAPATLAGLFHNLAGLAHSRGDAINGIIWAQRGIALRATLGDGAALESRARPSAASAPCSKLARPAG